MLNHESLPPEITNRSNTERVIKAIGFITTQAVFELALFALGGGPGLNLLWHVGTGVIGGLGNMGGRGSSGAFLFGTGLLPGIVARTVIDNYQKITREEQHRRGASGKNQA